MTCFSLSVISYIHYSPNKASAAEGFLLSLYRITFVHQVFASSA